MSGQAENQANVKFSYKKYYSFRNVVNRKFTGRFYSDMQIDYVARALCFGDTQPAVVVSAKPLIIAAYSDEMDAVVMLHFPVELTENTALPPARASRHQTYTSTAASVLPISYPAAISAGNLPTSCR